MSDVNIGDLVAGLRLDNTFSPGLKTARQDAKDFEADIAGTGEKVKTFGQQMGEAFRTPGGLTTIKTNLQSLGGELREAGTALSVGVTAPLAAMTVAAVKFGSDFERTMNLVGAVSNADAAGMKTLTAAAQEWGEKTKFSNTEAAKAMLELAKAGFNVKQTTDALPTTLALATAANLDLEKAATTTANVMSTFGLKTADMAHANDVLVAAANASTINVSDLTESIKYVGPVARAAHTPLAEIAAASALLGENGIKADMAGTGLRGMFTKLLAPTKDAQKAIDALGGDALKNSTTGTYDWIKVLDSLHGKLEQGGAVADQYTGLVMKGFGQRAGPAVIALATHGGAAVTELSATLDKSTGAAQRMTDAYMTGLPGAMEKAKGSIETASASMLTALEPTLVTVAGLVEKAANFVNGTLIPAFNAMPGPIKTGIVVLGGLAAAIGPVLVAAGAVASGIGAVAPLLPLVGAAISLLTGPIGLAVAAVVGLGVAWHTWGDDVTGYVSSTYESVKMYLWDKLEPVLTPIGGLLASVGKMFEALRDLVGAVFSKIIDLHVKLIEGVTLWLVDKLRPVIAPAVALFESIATTFSSVKDKVINFARLLYEGVKEQIVTRFTGIVDSIKSKIDAVAGFFRDLTDKVVGHSYFIDLIDGIAHHTGRLQNEMVAPIGEKCTLVTGFFRDMGANVFGHLTDLIGHASSWKSALSGIFEDLKSSLTSTVNDILQNVLGRLAQGMMNVLTGAGSFGSAFTGMLGGAGGVSGGLGGAASGLGGGATAGISAGIGAAAATAAAPLAAAALGTMIGMEVMAWKETGAWGQRSTGTGYEQVAPNDPYGYQNSSMSAADVANTLANQGSGFTFGDQMNGGVPGFNGVPSYRDGSDGYVDFGRGTLAMLHGEEKVTPKGRGDGPSIVHAPTTNVNVQTQAKSTPDLLRELRDLIRRNHDGALTDLQRLLVPGGA